MLKPDTPITVRTHHAASGEFGETATMTWGAFVASNDAGIVADVAEQIAVCNYAEIGGGSAPVVWVFA